MMRFTRFVETVFRRFLPSPFTIAIVLTLFTLVLALLFTENNTDKPHLQALLSFWETGIWNNGLLVFAYQMMLILVLGHVLVLSSPVERLILLLTRNVTNSANAAVLVVLPTMLVSFFNWGLGLIFGAILARKVGEYAQLHGIKINYPLIGASGYAGLMVWHGGISGSAPIKVSEKGHLKDLMSGYSGEQLLMDLPDTISTSLTVFSSWNLILFMAVLILISLMAYFMGKRSSPTTYQLSKYKFDHEPESMANLSERLDHSKIFATAFGLLIIVAFLLQYTPMLRSLNITPNMLNFFMLGLALILHGSFSRFLNAVEAAIGDTAGILIQFPLYFGIMGIMGSSGMINGISDFFVSISNELTFPIYTFFSAGLVNIFVPSGGGQWAVQGPMILETALQLNVPLPKAIMALAYGDQITNMLQPFWALPLLAITKLKAKEILPYTLLFMLAGIAVYVCGLLIF
ncbi:short-chain fatty acid transporter [Lentiprolixibacter aurantiacus]|uniref:TIGR00366 family protein n=1 Tax=Lentiprolixibacter aurantiacus TaxID=2993939 RepID=A0AAE3MJH5_9FLAO|nr:TIGR00366 family protein [Lentiprolixibacter aurantiacus]MCX2718252.1 TIGR00366 family protein [Lentiprolixibacter aurantiacus]